MSLINAKKTEIGTFNNLEGILKKFVVGKRFEVMRDSDRNGKYKGKIVTVNDKYNYGYEKDDHTEEEVYVGDIVWASLEKPKNNDETRLAFYLRELKPLDKIENPQFIN